MSIASVGEIDAPALKTVPSDTPLRDLIEEMLSEKFSQVGIIRNGELVGAVSFQSIARSLLVTEELFGDSKGIGGRTAELAVEKPKVVQREDDIEDLFDLLGERSFVLVRDESAKSEDEIEVPYRIITDYDIREFWRESTEPFLLIEETELTIRRIIATVYGDDLSDALREMSEDADRLRTVDRIEDCSFSHYSQFLSIHWEDGFDEYFSEQCDFIRALVIRLNENRNRLFHFRIDDRSELDLDVIRFAYGYFTSFAVDADRRNPD